MFGSSLGLCGCEHSRTETMPESVPPRTSFVPDDGRILFIVGQDLDAVRGYSSSGCCPRPAGSTTYIGLYNVLSADAEYGGLGVTTSGAPYPSEVDWGGGPIHLVRSAEEIGGVVAIGLDITEHGRPGAVSRIPRGDFDRQIDHLARTLSSLPHPVLLR
ncbi:MAG: hypothetical protein AAFV29_25900, partial [Myxococcota bacterium]